MRSCRVGFSKWYVPKMAMSMAFCNRIQYASGGNGERQVAVKQRESPPHA